ncbi:hypothetical protein D0809_28185, partial [Flavobacterium circumlabens]
VIIFTGHAFAANSKLSGNVSIDIFTNPVTKPIILMEILVVMRLKPQAMFSLTMFEIYPVVSTTGNVSIGILNNSITKPIILMEILLVMRLKLAIFFSSNV